jgi:hypothetical protein
MLPVSHINITSGYVNSTCLAWCIAGTHFVWPHRIRYIHHPKALAIASYISIIPGRTNFI